MAPPKKQALPKPLPDGFLLTDSDKKKWRLGKIIGQGGFGLIYLASQDVERPVPEDTNFVIKVEYKENGPLFSELKFYQRAAKPESMKNWMKSRKLKFLGIPTYWGSGLAEHNGLSYRFMAMDRLGSDIQKVFEHNGGRRKEAYVLQLGRLMVDILEYIHENEYVHADIKAANLMQGYRDPEQVYLVDYGLSYRYCPDGVHKEYKENPKKGHNGTIEYTSIDAHKGVAPSRRSDFQILGFCLLHWLCGSLPWDHVLKNPDQVMDAKIRLMDKLPQSVQQLSVNGANTGEVAAFLNYVKSLDHHQKPDYKHLKDLLARGREEGNLDFSIDGGPTGQLSTKGQDPPARGKKVGQGRGASKAKSAATELDDDDDEEEVKPKPGAAAHHHRGQPALTDSHSKKEEVRRSSRTTKPKNYAEAIHSEEDDEVQESRPTRIPACYIRGPPIGPRTQSKKIAEPRRTSKKTQDFRVSSARHRGEESVQPARIKRMYSDEGTLCFDYRDGYRGGVIRHRTAGPPPPASSSETSPWLYVLAAAALSFVVFSLVLLKPFSKTFFSPQQVMAVLLRWF